MGKIGWIVALFLAVILAISSISLLMVKPASAQTTPKPSVPEFTITLVGPPITVNTTYSLDPNTGQIVAQIGFTQKYSYVVVTVKNQPFTSFKDSSGNTISFYYNIQTKNHNSSDDWFSSYNPDYGYPTPSQGDYTNISIPIDFSTNGVRSVPSGSQTDIQVEAMIGYVNRNFTNGYFNAPWAFYGQTSGWSISKTIAVPANIPLTSTSPTPTPTMPNSGPTSSPTPSPTVPELSWLAILPLLASTFAVMLFVKQHNVKKTWVK